MLFSLRKGKHLGALLFGGLVFATSRGLFDEALAAMVAAGVFLMIELVWEYSARRTTEKRLSALLARREQLRVCVDCGAILEPGTATELEPIEPVDLRVDVLLEEGKKVEAVKAVLDARGSGLKDALDRVRSRERDT